MKGYGIGYEPFNFKGEYCVSTVSEISGVSASVSDLSSLGDSKNIAASYRTKTRKTGFGELFSTGFAANLNYCPNLDSKY